MVIILKRVEHGVNQPLHTNVMPIPLHIFCTGGILPTFSLPTFAQIPNLILKTMGMLFSLFLVYAISKTEMKCEKKERFPFESVRGRMFYENTSITFQGR